MRVLCVVKSFLTKNVLRGKKGREELHAVVLQYIALEFNFDESKKKAVVQNGAKPGWW